MVLLELSLFPMSAGDSVSSYVAQCLDIIDSSGLEYELHSMGTIIEGELDDVLSVMRLCIEALATDFDRVTCSAKLDYRRGKQGRLKSKVESVQRKVGRKLKTGSS